MVSNEDLRVFLEGLNWSYNDTLNMETARWNEIDEKSLVFGTVLRGLNKIKLGKCVYFKFTGSFSRVGPHLTPRRKIKPKTPSYTITKKLIQKIKGVIT